MSTAELLVELLLAAASLASLAMAVLCWRWGRDAR